MRFNIVSLGLTIQRIPPLNCYVNDSCLTSGAVFSHFHNVDYRKQVHHTK